VKREAYLDKEKRKTKGKNNKARREKKIWVVVGMLYSLLGLPLPL
jgi:hypothetical protein